MQSPYQGEVDYEELKESKPSSGMENWAMKVEILRESGIRIRRLKLMNV